MPQGVPDYVLAFYDLLELTKSRLSLVGAWTELGAGYAADAYARLGMVWGACA